MYMYVCMFVIDYHGNLVSHLQFGGEWEVLWSKLLIRQALLIYNMYACMHVPVYSARFQPEFVDFDAILETVIPTKHSDICTVYSIS